jgi:hypothetical protein
MTDLRKDTGVETNVEDNQLNQAAHVCEQVAKAELDIVSPFATHQRPNSAGLSPREACESCSEGTATHLSGISEYQDGDGKSPCDT